MKAPKWLVVGTQAAIDAGLNAFAIKLVAESYGDDPEKFKGESILCVAHTHKGTPIQILIMPGEPKREDYE